MPLGCLAVSREMPNPRKPRPSCLYCNKELNRPSARYCNHDCQFDHEYVQYIVRWKQGIESGNRGINGEVSHHVRRFLFEKYHNRCAQCGWSKRHPLTGKIPLTVEHIDGNGFNTIEENLTLLCPNCQALTPTYGGYNRGKGRDSRRRAGVV